MPETVMYAVQELVAAYTHYREDASFKAELLNLYKNYAGRPSLLYYAEKMTKDLGGAKIYLKREDLNHTGAHKINNVLGQALLAKKMDSSSFLKCPICNRGISPWLENSMQLSIMLISTSATLFLLAWTNGRSLSTVIEILPEAILYSK